MIYMTNNNGTIYNYDLFMAYLNDTNFNGYKVYNTVMCADEEHCVINYEIACYGSSAGLIEGESYNHVEGAMVIFNLEIETFDPAISTDEYLIINCLTILDSFEEELIDVMIKDLENVKAIAISGNYNLNSIFEAEEVEITVHPNPITDIDAYEKKVDEFVGKNGRLPVGEELDNLVDDNKGDVIMNNTTINFTHDDTLEDKDNQIQQLLAEIHLLKEKNEALVMEADYSNERVLKAEKCFKELKAAYFAEKKAKEALEKRLEKAADVYKTLKAAYFKVKKMYQQKKGETKTKPVAVRTHPVAVDNAKVYDTKKTKSNINVCDGCKKGLTVKAATFCKNHSDKFEGKKLCFECQKKIVTPVKWNDVPVATRHAIYDEVIKQCHNK